MDNRFEYKLYKIIDNWSTEEDNKDGYYLTPLQINNNDENSDDNNTNIHSDFLIGKAVAMAVSFGMIKDVKTIEVTSNLINNFQSSMITHKMCRNVSVFDYSRFNRKLISFWWQFLLILIIFIILSLILVIIWSLVKLTINIGFRYFIQNYLDWWRKGLLIFNEMKKG
jgi:hypothetical protein